MNRLILAVALAAGCTLASSAPAYAAAAKNYDCSKPGNANKAVCKNAAKQASKAATAAAPAKAKAAPAKPAETKVSSTTTTKTVTQKNYDCSKAGNKNKAVCKLAAATQTASKPVAMPKPAPVAMKPAAVPAAKPAVRHAAPPAANASAENSNPAGAIAQCKDGTYSHAKGHSGACSRHGGVAKWM